MTTLWVFIQRLFSAPGQAEVRKAYMEAGALVVTIPMFIAAFKAKDIGTMFTQGTAIYTALATLALTIASIFSSNKAAIANPNLKNIRGKDDGSEPTNVPIPVNPTVTGA